MTGYPDAKLILPNVREDIDEWVAVARPVGSFLEAVLTNNLTESISRADPEHMENIPHIVAYLYNRCPSSCWGSQKRFAEWQGTRS